MSLNEKLDYLNRIKNTRYPNTIVHFINQQTQEIWDESKQLINCTESDLVKVNLIRVLPFEIILDIEQKYLLKSIVEKVKQKGWNYEVWDTGSRGYHIYLKFSNLEEQALNVRNRIRKYIIKEFETDEALAKESQFVSCPYAPHFKTENIKTSVDSSDNGTPNIIPDDIINYAIKELELKEKFVLENDEQFEDFINDPYLKYALNNKILNGGRNDILFKNLAIGLVRSGLGRREIMEYGKRIIINCPGKNIAEFSGWVDKALMREITEYNKYEMIQWAIQYNRPVLYKINDEGHFKDLLSAKMLWDILWDAKIIEQPVWKELCFYNLLGTIVDERDEDYRVHVIFSSPSGSGKDEGLNLSERVLKDLDYITKRPSSATDKTLVGGVNQVAVDYNTKWGLENESDDTDKRQYKKEIEDGWLKTVQWMAFGESESIFRPGTYNKQVHIILRQAMDKNRSIEKGVGGKTISINTNTSFILTTFSMDNTIYKLLHNGLFQRALYYDKELPKKEHKAIQHKMSEVNFNPTVKEHYDEKGYYELLLKKLKETKLWYDENKNKIKWYPGCDQYINTLWDSLEKDYESLSKTDNEILDSIVRRSNNNLHKLLVLHAVWNRKPIIDQTDVDKCFGLIKTCIESIKRLILKQDRKRKRTLIILEILKKESLSTMNLYKKMEEQINIKSTATKVKLINLLKDMDLISEYREGNTIKLSLTTKGADTVEFDI